VIAISSCLLGAILTFGFVWAASGMWSFVEDLDNKGRVAIMVLLAVELFVTWMLIGRVNGW